MSYLERNGDAVSLTEMHKADRKSFLIMIGSAAVMIGSTFFMGSTDEPITVGIYECRTPGRKVSIEERNIIIVELDEYSHRLNLELSVDPQRVVCAVDEEGQLSFHVEKDQEELVDAAFQYTEDN